MLLEKLLLDTENTGKIVYSKKVKMPWKAI